jgi:hypothetical protein
MRQIKQMRAGPVERNQRVKNACQEYNTRWIYVWLLARSPECKSEQGRQLRRKRYRLFRGRHFPHRLSAECRRGNASESSRIPGHRGRGCFRHYLRQCPAPLDTASELQCHAIASKQAQTSTQMRGGSLPANVKRTSALRRVPPLEAFRYRPALASEAMFVPSSCRAMPARSRWKRPVAALW